MFKGLYLFGVQFCVHIFPFKITKVQKVHFNQYYKFD